MKNLIFIIAVSIFLFYGCKSKETFIKNVSCSGKVKVEYEWLDWDKEDREHVISNRFTENHFTVYFVSEYKDSLRMYIDNEYRAKSYVEKKENEEDLAYGFSFGLNKNQIPVLKIESSNQKTCFDVKMETKYPTVYIWLDRNGNWTLRFSNFIHSDKLTRTAYNTT